jgi:hypothetical protein
LKKTACMKMQDNLIGYLENLLQKDLILYNDMSVTTAIRLSISDLKISDNAKQKLKDRVKDGEPIVGTLEYFKAIIENE